MAHTHTILLYHFVFSTKHRRPLLTPVARQALFPYMARILLNLEAKALILNGVEDHVHVLCQLRPHHSVSEVIKSLKGSSSAWFNREGPGGVLHWQDGYGAFTVSLSNRDAVYQYIATQEARHRSQTFADEYEGLLRLNEIEYDARFHLD